MADETVRIIRIETGGSEQTVKGLKDEINSLRDALLNTEKGTEDYKKVLEQLIADQQKLAEVMNAGKTQVSAATGSYNALVNQMAALKKVWRETTDEASRKELGNQIKDLNDKLKGMDESIGDYRRNVGNYANAISASFSQMGGAAKGMVGPLSSVKAGLTAISSHPIVAVITVLAGLLINGIAKGFKSSEDNMNKLRVAFSGFQAIGDAVTTMFQKLAGWIAKVAEAAMKFADKLGLITPKMKERQKLTERQIALEKQERDNIVKNAELETQAAELREKASDEENYSIGERIEFLKQAQAEEEKILQNERDILAEKLAILTAQNQINGSTAEALKQQAELEAEVKKVDAKISASRRSTNKEIAGLNRRGLSEQQQANQARLSLEKDLIQQELDLAEEGSDDQLRLAKELRKKELEIQQEGFKTKIKNRKDYEQAIKLSTQAYNADIMKLEADYNRKSAEKQVNEYYDVLLRGVREGSSEQFTILGERANKLLTTAVRGSDESVHAFNERLETYRKEADKYFDQAQQALEREVEISNQIVLNGLRPMSKYYREQYNQLKDYYNNIQKLNGESNEEFAARQDAAWKAVIDSLSNLHQSIIDETAGYTNAMNVMYEQNASVLTKLGYQLKDYQTEWDQSLMAVRNIVNEDMDSILKALSERSDEFQRRFKGLMPNPENIMSFLNTTDITKMSEEQLKNVKELMNMLIKDGLIPENVINSYLESIQGMVDTEKAILQERYDNWDNLTSGIVALTNNIADAYEADLKYAVEHNQKSEEMAKQEFETVKGLRISAAIVDTIQGALAAFMGWQDKGQPWGAIIGATQAAATLAAGWAQIRQIQSTKFGASGSGGSTMMAQAQVVPVMADYNPQMTGNLTSQQETEDLANAITSKPIRAYVVESDITSAQQLANQRQAESTF